MIATLAQLKSYLGITDNNQDTILTLLINSSNQMIETYIGRIIEAGNYVEYIDGNAQRELLLENYPVIKLTKIELNIGSLDLPVRETVSASSYKLSPKDGKIFLLFLLQRGFQNYKITYEAGYNPIPADLTLASLKLASKYYNSKDSDGIKGESNNGDRLDFDVSQIPNDILIILNNYRDIYV